MTTTDMTADLTPPPAGAGRLLRRSRTNRVAAGVSSGLGDYFGVDPVLFRVLFATSAFFGGAGILAYLLAWAAIPEQGTERAPIDGWIAALRRRAVPIWLVALVAGIALWVAAFSWWAPGPFLPVVAVVVLLVVFFGRRDLQAAPGGEPVDLTKQPAAAPDAGAPAGADAPTWVYDARSWFEQSRLAWQAKRRRALPIRIATLCLLAATLLVLGIADAVSGLAFQYYFWATLAIVGAGLLVGIVARRAPWGLAVLLVPAIAGAVAFGGSSMQVKDGVGQREWKPTAAPAQAYRLAFGQGTLDLTALPAQSAARTVHVTAGAGQIRIVAPRTLNLTVLANIHIGQVQVDGVSGTDGHGGVGISRTVSPPAGATGAPITVDVHLADGSLVVEHR